MSTLIILFIILALWHFVYQAILLPSFRLKLRFKLFTLRDETRALKMKHQNDFSEETFRWLEGRINSIIANLRFIEFSTLYEANKFIKSDKKIEEKIRKRMSDIEDCKIVEVRDVYNDSLKIFLLTLLANGGSWGIFLIPIALLTITFQVGMNLIKEVLLLSDNDLERFITNKDVALT